MVSMPEMMARYAKPGQVDALLVRPERRAAMVSIQNVTVSKNGLDGDRSRAGKRAVSLIQAEHLPVIAALAGAKDVSAEILRRNIVVSGLNLAAFRGQALKIGTTVLELTVPCHPCSRIEEVLGPGGYTAMRGHGGMCASVAMPGQIRRGDPVVPVV